MVAGDTGIIGEGDLSEMLGSNFRLVALSSGDPNS